MDNKLFLVEGDLNTTPYMEASTSKPVRRLVWALSFVQAADKFEQHFAAMSREYEVSFRATVTDISEAIS
jgi:hypothetical protein